MENALMTPSKPITPNCLSEQKRLRSPLSVLQSSKRLNLTPSYKPDQLLDNSTFAIDNLLQPKLSQRSTKLPLPLLVQSSSQPRPKEILSILSTIRSKSNKNKENLKKPAQKTVHFCQDVEITEKKAHSIATTSHSVTESRCEAQEESQKFKYEEERKSEVELPDFEEFPTVAFCQQCKKDIVTVVELERVRGDYGFFGKVSWAICWCLPACFFSDSNLVHRCMVCRSEIARVISN